MQQKSPEAYLLDFIEDDKKMDRWVWVLQNWEQISKDDNNKKIIKAGIRAGIPDLIRGQVWQYLMNLQSKNKEEGVLKYVEYLEQETKEYENVILSDIHRTFPKHPLFVDDGGQGQVSLYNVLKAYAVKNRDVGYCQGMGFLTAIFLTYMNEETSFWFLDHLIKKNQLQGFYMASMPALNVAFYKLTVSIKRLLPKLYSHFFNIKLGTSTYASQWFLTLFAVNFQFEIFVRIWDIYFYEGQKTIFRFGLAILDLNQEALISNSFENTVRVITKDMYKSVNMEELIKRADKFKISTGDLMQIELDLQENPDEEVKQFLFME